MAGAEGEVLELATRAVADGVLDDAVLRRIKDALLRLVEFDRIAIHVEDPASKTFWVLWRDTRSSDAPPAAFATGIHVLNDPRITRPAPGEAQVVPYIDPDGTSLERALYKTNVRSYVVVPMAHGGADVAWFTLAHHVPGAPAQAHLPMLLALGKVMAPALVRTRERLRARLFEMLVEESPDGVLALDAAGSIIEANAAALRLLGMTRANVLARPIGNVLDAAAADALKTPWDGALKTLLLEAEPRRPALDVVLARLEGMSDAAFRAHLHDASGRRAAEEATRRRVDHLAFLRDLSETMAGDLHVETALERAATFCASRAEVGGVLMYRAEPGDVLRLAVARGIGARTAERLNRVTAAELERMLDSPAADVRRAHGVVQAEGAALDPETTGTVPRWKILVPLAHARRPLGAMLVMGRMGASLSDSERELWENVAGTVSAALHAADDFEHVVALEAEKRLLVDNLPVIVARLDPKTGATLFVNGAVERVLGFAAAETLGQPGMDALLADPIEWEASAIARDRAARGLEPGWQERRYKHKDGRILTLRECVYPVRDPSGVVRAIQVLAYDVTTEIETRKQLMQADRLASLGALAAGIAHEINNPVAFIGLATGQVGKMVDAGEDRERIHQLLHDVGEAAGRIANIVGELKLFTRIPEGAHVTPVDVNRMVQMAVTLTSAELRQGARLEINLGELPLVPGEYASLGQAFVNLLLNAAQAVRAQRLEGPGASFVRVSTFVAAGAIVVRVSDTGVGIEPRLLPRIFEPFFKTRATSDGAGLGLSIAHNLVRRVGGDIRVTSTPGEGSTFEVVLPVEGASELDRSRRWRSRTGRRRPPR
jgi:PAS domain S-box-containing protein